MALTQEPVSGSDTIAYYYKLLEYRVFVYRKENEPLFIIMQV